ncbi:pseudouridine-5'-phosphate glycosidase [Mangrovicoccus ximenensis]|uniref:pseudouridine-5'-phosphate glycosidase n=1 Tax=Mangrovicoccus ximenensis TaxID=1911570 RepID=UPI001F28C042|nr:pseudouridine-5'-phosphate glycosidase [Mangrovicoccus ximenensis]
MTPDIRYSTEVAAARELGGPIVALESTIITHGMPYPRNLETARAVENDIRTAGAVPATIAVIDGVLHVGLEGAELEALAQRSDVAKLSRADLAVAMATGISGATTVAATMIAARAAGIRVFATGGIGGVHKGAEDSFDISADLQELAQTPVTVVCAGAKAILDLPKTLEVLETLGVPVFAYGQDALPAFWSRDSGLAAPLRADMPADAALVVVALLAALVVIAVALARLLAAVAVLLGFLLLAAGLRIALRLAQKAGVVLIGKASAFDRGSRQKLCSSTRRNCFRPTFSGVTVRFSGPHLW